MFPFGTSFVPKCRGVFLRHCELFASVPIAAFPRRSATSKAKRVHLILIPLGDDYEDRKADVVLYLLPGNCSAGSMGPSSKQPGYDWYSGIPRPAHGSVSACTSASGHR